VRRRLRIEGIAQGGEGVARDGARPVFVPFTAPGDEVEVDVAPGEGPAHAEPAAVVVPGPDRVAPPCVHFGPPGASEGAEGRADRLCGGCEWLHLAYPAQLAAKERSFFETLRRIGRAEPGTYEAGAIVPSPEPLRYRARAKFHFDRASGRLVFFRRRSHDPVRLRVCHLLRPGLDALREASGPALAAAGLAPREAILEWSDREARGAAWLSVPAISPAVRSRAEALLGRVPGLAGVLLEADGGTRATIGDPVLSHDRRPGDPAAGVQRSRPDVFQQANRGANAALVDLALALLRPDGAEALELHCGAGNFTAPLAARARAVHAVEVQGPALELARAGLAGANVRFQAGDALRAAAGLAAEGRRFEAVLLDPPREGAKGVGPVLRALGASRAVYVSCDPATLARDLRGCAEAGFRLVHARPVDMFPQTHHVEGVALLERAG
jgi:23S rRNA (uracil1939-C5)-methyltransferase